MGLALSSSTSVELQISSNYRWATAARYNAEAGIEYGRSLLMSAPSWAGLLPPARLPTDHPDWSPTKWETTPLGSPTATAPQTRAARNFENWQCDERGYGMGYGVVYDDGGAAGPEEYRTQVGGATLNGAFTLWIRRPVRWKGLNGVGTELEDYPENDVLVLVSEGVAPFTGANNANAAYAANRAAYVIETLLTRAGTTIFDQSACSSRQGQSGGSASGGNSSGCVMLQGGSQITEALTGVSGADPNANLK